MELFLGILNGGGFWIILQRKQSYKYKKSPTNSTCSICEETFSEMHYILCYLETLGLIIALPLNTNALFYNVLNATFKVES